MALQVTSLFLLSIAANFDKVAVLCHKEGCDGMLDRWPKDFQDRVHIFDGAQIDPMYTNQVGAEPALFGVYAVDLLSRWRALRGFRKTLEDDHD